MSLIIILHTKTSILCQYAVQQIHHKCARHQHSCTLMYSDNKLFDLCGVLGVNDPSFCTWMITMSIQGLQRASLHELALTPVQPVLVPVVGIILHCPWWTVPGTSDTPAADPLLCILCMSCSYRKTYRSLSLSLPTYQEGCYIL